MAWYNNIFGAKPVEAEEKLNPAQYNIGSNKVESSREPAFSYERAYEDFSVERKRFPRRCSGC
jgi:hypothetical protein